MDKGRPELLRFLPRGLLVAGVSTGDEGWIGDEGCIGVELRCGFGARSGFGPSWGGDELGVELCEFCLLCPDSWDINERTGDYLRTISTG